MEISPEIIDLCQSALEQELKNARMASKQLNEAMKNGVQDIELLCQLSDPLMDSMLGFSGKGKRTYLKFIKYVESFDPMTAEKIRDGFEDALGYKNHAVYVAARIAKEWHQGHTDKGGVDYFEGHLAMVAQLCFDWKAKTVAFLHDVAEDTAQRHINYAHTTAKYQNDGQMDYYMSEAISLAARMGVVVCDCYSEWKKLALHQDTTMLLANRINHPLPQMHELFARKLYEVIIGIDVSDTTAESTMCTAAN